ncbi:diaminobutyrate acetyltransferase [Streptomyces djakartensis]|uniref:L-2,4-diaminobutyric acid acetyltransferase n=1 Tax=Streptomyces djakartensis TaxID=68193 RepID=A0ABQ2ZWV8_9ACTN|nr:diaminobutyrate acetyltransferase [Streptomyces djakartensis]GGY25066.1 L-2,4-diaminobutyric acid acetyltransferase [Streptomyces djakartensis]
MTTLTEYTEKIGEPTVADGPAVWRIARESGKLDVNSPYSYLLWFRDFANTSAVARGDNGTLAGFTTGYRRPDRPDVLVIWQIAVAGGERGRGLAGAMLDHLTGRLHAQSALHRLETTISPGNTASHQLFLSFAERHKAPLKRELLFPAELFPDAHEPEYLYRIGPLR